MGVDFNKQVIGTTREAEMRHGYTQKAIGDHLGVHYATINRIVSCNKC